MEWWSGEVVGWWGGGVVGWWGGGVVGWWGGGMVDQWWSGEGEWCEEGGKRGQMSKVDKCAAARRTVQTVQNCVDERR